MRQFVVAAGFHESPHDWMTEKFLWPVKKVLLCINIVHFDVQLSLIVKLTLSKATLYDTSTDDEKRLSLCSLDIDNLFWLLSCGTGIS